MDVLFICKASVRIGFGHLIRSKALASTFHKNLLRRGRVKLIVIGDKELISPLIKSENYENEIIASERDFVRCVKKWDFIFLDMLTIDDNVFGIIKNNAKHTATVSPIFNRISDVDYFFHRTKYHNLSNELLPAKTFMGLEYTIVQPHCIRINAGRFEESINNHSFSFAVSMGGGDASNKTLQFLKSFKKFDLDASIWVMLGEGYKHSFDELIKVAKTNHRHEIVLAKTNRNMWQILQNCLLGFFPGGITTYEAVYSGLPSINFIENESNSFLLKELVENNAAYLINTTNETYWPELNRLIQQLNSDRLMLMEMHLKAKKLIDGKGAERIFELCQSS